jgi:hypothetical protein
VFPFGLSFSLTFLVRDLSGPGGTFTDIVMMIRSALLAALVGTAVAIDAPKVKAALYEEAF